MTGRDTKDAPDLEVLRAVASGATLDVVARHYGVSTRTVRRRVERVKDRLGVATTVEAVREAVRRGWV